MNTPPVQFEGTVAILTAGPSLSEHWNEACYDDYDSVIAVNFAGFIFKHDWFSFWEKWLLNSSVYSPVFQKDMHRQLPQTGYIVNKPYETDKPCITVPMLFQSSSYTMPNTLRHILSLTQQSAQVDIYGMDLNGEVDCLGNSGANRDLNRWKKELTDLMPFLQDPRVKVVGGIADILYHHLDKIEKSQLK